MLNQTLGRALTVALLVSLGFVVACSPASKAGTGQSHGGGSSGTSSSGDSGAFGNSNTAAVATDAMTPISLGGTGCAPGHYTGSFKGTYNSAAWGNGSVPLMVDAVASMGRPGLEFWLEKTAKTACTNSEFCGDFTVKGGKIRGFANPFPDPNAPPDAAPNPFALAIRFEIDFGGALDCSTGKFMGLLQNGCYDVATILYRFEGTAPAVYDKPTTTFTMGEWTVKEKPMAGVIFPPDSKIGGMGTWNAKLADTGTSPVATGMGLCDTPAGG